MAGAGLDAVFCSEDGLMGGELSAVGGRIFVVNPA